jgi:hypothetical protein
MPAIRGAKLVPILDGTSQAPPATIEVAEKDGKKIIPNPEHDR